MTTATRTALEAFAPQLEADYVKFATGTLERLIAEFGPALRGIANSPRYHALQGIAHVVSRGDAAELRHDRLAAAAAEYAAATIDAWAAKIDAKLGELDDAQLVRGAGFTFTLTGSKNGRRVVIEQDRIVNVSSKGTLFNQYPARIYVDGKFTSAAAFAKL